MRNKTIQYICVMLLSVSLYSCGTVVNNDADPVSVSLTPVNASDFQDEGEALAPNDDEGFDYAFKLSETDEEENAEYNLDNNDIVLGEYTTEFNVKNKARTKNISKASSAINNTVVEPGEEFSYNDSVGPTTKANGFLLAKIFVRGKDSKGYGGGVCQVSSTLYNSILDAGLEVTERHPHSKKVSYVPEDRDAATSYGGIDLKFVNDYDFPIIISSNVDNGSITVAIERYVY